MDRPVQLAWVDPMSGVSETGHHQQPGDALGPSIDWLPWNPSQAKTRLEARDLGEGA